MSKSRLLDLKEALGDSGFELLNELGDPKYTDSIFSPTTEIFVWGITHPEIDEDIELEFHIFGELGCRSNKLNDILYCKVKGRLEKLYFEKRASERWKKGLVEFIEALKCPKEDS